VKTALRYLGWLTDWLIGWSIDSFICNFSTEDIEDLLDETKEAIDKQREIDELLSGQLTQVSPFHRQTENSSLVS